MEVMLGEWIGLEEKLVAELFLCGVLKLGRRQLEKSFCNLERRKLVLVLRGAAEGCPWTSAVHRYKTRGGNTASPTYPIR